MRDAIRELDVERAADVRGGVVVDVAKDGTAAITLPRDGLDRMLSERRDVHDGCLDANDLADAEAKGRAGGYAAALRDVRSLAPGAA